jgi:hypothetical protein
LSNLRFISITESSMLSNMVLSFIHVTYRILKIIKYLYSAWDDKTRHQQIYLLLFHSLGVFKDQCLSVWQDSV